MTADYKADSWTSSLTLANPDIVNGSGVGVLHYLKSVTPNLALGAELAYQVKVSAWWICYGMFCTKLIVYSCM